MSESSNEYEGKHEGFPAVEEVRSHPLLSNRTYDILKAVAQYVLPAVGALYFTVAQIWGLPNAVEVVGTVAALDLFLGTILGYAKKTYTESDARFDGVMHVGPAKNSLVLNEDVETLEEKKEVVFKVENPQ